MSDEVKQGIPAPGSVSVKQRIKRLVQSHPRLWRTYWTAKMQVKRIAMLRFFLHDIRYTYGAMFWHPSSRTRDTLAAEMLFQYHKLEKGLVMPGPKRMFGIDPVRATMTLARRWIAAGHRRDDPVFLGAVETLAAYRANAARHGLDVRGQVLGEVDRFLADVPERDHDLSTPRALPSLHMPDGSNEADRFRRLAEARRSVRSFTDKEIPKSLLESAVSIAQLSPSACNRQPCRVYFVTDQARKAQLLGHQNGNRGFGHLAPVVAAITADEHCFFDASERHEPYIDGGLFSMSFALALQAHGVASCCLNWCVPPSDDVAAHRIAGIPLTRRIVMLMAIGYAIPECQVPRSPRRKLDDVVVWVEGSV